MIVTRLSKDGYVRANFTMRNNLALRCLGGFSQLGFRTGHVKSRVSSIAHITTGICFGHYFDWLPTGALGIGDRK